VQAEVSGQVSQGALLAPDVAADPVLPAGLPEQGSVSGLALLGESKAAASVSQGLTAKQEASKVGGLVFAPPECHHRRPVGRLSAPYPFRPAPYQRRVPKKAVVFSSFSYSCR
jgi:hypothetical protein